MPFLAASPASLIFQTNKPDSNHRNAAIVYGSNKLFEYLANAPHRLGKFSKRLAITKLFSLSQWSQLLISSGNKTLRRNLMQQTNLDSQTDVLLTEYILRPSENARRFIAWKVSCCAKLKTRVYHPAASSD